MLVLAGGSTENDLKTGAGGFDCKVCKKTNALALVCCVVRVITSALLHEVLFKLA